LLATFLIYHAGYYLTAKAAPIEGVSTPQSVQLFSAVRAQLPKDAVVIFRGDRSFRFGSQARPLGRSGRALSWPRTEQ